GVVVEELRVVSTALLDRSHLEVAVDELCIGEIRRFQVDPLQVEALEGAALQISALVQVAGCTARSLDHDRRLPLGTRLHLDGLEHRPLMLSAGACSVEALCGTDADALRPADLLRLPCAPGTGASSTAAFVELLLSPILLSAGGRLLRPVIDARPGGEAGDTFLEGLGVPADLATDAAAVLGHLGRPHHDVLLGAGH